MRFLQLDIAEIPKVSMFHKESLSRSVLHKTRVAPDYIIYIVTKGELHLKVNNEDVVLCEGDFRVFFKGEFQQPVSPGEVEYYYIHLSNDKLGSADYSREEFAEKMQSRNGYLSELDFFSGKCYENVFIYLPEHMHFSKSELDYVSDRWFGELLEHEIPLDKRMNLVSRATELFLFTERLFYNEICGKHAAKKSEIMAENLAGYIMKNYDKNIGSKEIEREFGVSFDYANRIFKNKNNISIIKFRNKIRIEKAKMLISTTNMTLATVAEKVGFCDEYYFSRVFKQFEGVSPKKFA